jgi:Domain of unknown function (DUF4160)
VGSKTFDGVRFAAYTDDHLPPHVHGFYAGVEAIIDLSIPERAVRLSGRKKRVRPKNAKRSDVDHIRETARRNFDALVDLWESA